MEGSDLHDIEDLVDQEEDGEVFELIRRVETRSFLYNCQDPRHSKRGATNHAWNSIAEGLIIRGKAMNGDRCRLKWKALKDYYFRVKKAGKGKSGDGAKRKKPWIYYSAMDRLLSAFNEENDNTQSNFPGDDSNNPSPTTSRPETPSDNMGDKMEMESTPAVNSTRKDRKRKSEEHDQLVQDKILKILEEPEEVKDQFYHFGMTVCNKLRSMPPEMSEFAMMRVTSVLYEICFPPPPPMGDWQGWRSPPNEESPEDELP